jgi:transcriptional regulator with XRE-family HTH domain
MALTRHEALENLRQFVIDQRTKRRMSQRDLAKAAGVSHATISHLESARGTVPKQESLQAIASGLGVPYEMLDRLARGIDPDAGDDVLSPELAAVFADVITWPEADQERFLAVVRALRPHTR